VAKCEVIDSTAVMGAACAWTLPWSWWPSSCYFSVGRLSLGRSSDDSPCYKEIADVFVHDVPYCLEVQLKPTQFRQRTKGREAAGAKVCWFILVYPGKVGMG
jgi:hypothetical protein